ncbi:MAG: twin-arginine translocase subunit TatC [Firmicutes bacterium]|jgi:sec-independent protein translocase protein TatC|nr:twin-arginine translocase subunit TatC [Bacillota bacterium]HPU01991.1 twin-arginine translocase subunit TatC [Bacillota bacterium]
MKEQTWLRLLGELRKRLILIFLFIAAGAVCCFFFVDRIRNILLLPTLTPRVGEFFLLFVRQFPFRELPPGGELPVKMIFLTPGEAFLADLRLSLVCSMMLVMPLILFQLVSLVMAARGGSRRGPFLLVLAVCFLFLLGLAFAYFVAFPFAINFFLGFASDDVAAEWSIARYLSFATSFLFAFGLVFQIPLLFWLLGSMGLINADFLKRHRRIAVVIILIAAAVLTPPDVFSQILMAIPLFILYECSIILVSIAQRKRAQA